MNLKLFFTSIMILYRFFRLLSSSSPLCEMFTVMIIYSCLHYRSRVGVFCRRLARLELCTPKSNNFYWITRHRLLRYVIARRQIKLSVVVAKFAKLQEVGHCKRSKKLVFAVAARNCIWFAVQTLHLIFSLKVRSTSLSGTFVPSLNPSLCLNRRA